MKEFGVRKSLMALGCLLITANISLGGLISGVTIGSASSEDTSWANEVAVNTINGSGFDAVTGVHDTDVNNMWQATGSDATPVLVWDLGGQYTLESMKVWNFNRWTGEWFIRHYGARNVDIYVSSDSDLASATWTPILNTNLTIAPEYPLSTPYNTPDALTINQNARLVKMVINNTHMVDCGWWYNGASAGLSEVQFFGTPVPEPMSLMLLLGGLGLIRRKR